MWDQFLHAGKQHELGLALAGFGIELEAGQEGPQEEALFLNSAFITDSLIIAGHCHGFVHYGHERSSLREPITNHIPFLQMRVDTTPVPSGDTLAFSESWASTRQISGALWIR